MAVGGIAGVLLEQAALHVGPISVSQPLMVIVDPVVSIVLGVWLFGEQFTHDPLVLAVAAVRSSRSASASSASCAPRPRPSASRPDRRRQSTLRDPSATAQETQSPPISAADGTVTPARRTCSTAYSTRRPGTTATGNGNAVSYTVVAGDRRLLDVRATAQTEGGQARHPGRRSTTGRAAAGLSGRVKPRGNRAGPRGDRPARVDEPVRSRTVLFVLLALQRLVGGRGRWRPHLDDEERGPGERPVRIELVTADDHEVGDEDRPAGDDPVVGGQRDKEIVEARRMEDEVELGHGALVTAGRGRRHQQLPVDQLPPEPVLRHRLEVVPGEDAIPGQPGQSGPLGDSHTSKGTRECHTSTTVGRTGWCGHRPGSFAPAPPFLPTFSRFFEIWENCRRAVYPAAVQARSSSSDHVLTIRSAGMPAAAA